MKRIIIAVLIALLLTRSPAAMAENAARFPAYDEATGKWGYIDVNGQWAIAPQFETAGIFRGSYAAVSTGDPWEYTMGVIDGSGSWVVEPHYFVDEGYDGWTYGGLNEGMYLVWDSRAGDEARERPHYGYFDVPSGYFSGIVFYGENRWWTQEKLVPIGDAFYDRATGQKVIGLPEGYYTDWHGNDSVFHDGFAPIQKEMPSGEADETCFVDQKGQIIELPNLRFEIEDWACGLLCATEKEAASDEPPIIGYFDLNAMDWKIASYSDPDGQVCRFLEAYPFSGNGYACVKLADGNYGHIDLHGNVLFRDGYVTWENQFGWNQKQITQPYQFFGDYAWIEEANVLIDPTGKAVLEIPEGWHPFEQWDDELEHTKDYYVSPGGVVNLQRRVRGGNDQSALMKLNGEWLLDPEIYGPAWDDAMPEPHRFFSEGLQAVEKIVGVKEWRTVHNVKTGDYQEPIYETKVGYVNEQGDVIADFLYDGGGAFLNGLAMVTRGSETGYINARGEEVFFWTLTDQEEYTEDDSNCVYYNPQGGRYYHADRYCPSVSTKYWPLSPIPFDKVYTLLPCAICKAPERPPISPEPTEEPPENNASESSLRTQEYRFNTLAENTVEMRSTPNFITDDLSSSADGALHWMVLSNQGKVMAEAITEKWGNPPVIAFADGDIICLRDGGGNGFWYTFYDVAQEMVSGIFQNVIDMRGETVLYTEPFGDTWRIVLAQIFSGEILRSQSIDLRTAEGGVEKAEWDEKSASWRISYLAGDSFEETTVIFPMQSLTAVNADTDSARFPAYDEATGKWGYIDVNGQWAIAPQYDGASGFRGGYARVTLYPENHIPNDAPFLDGDYKGVIDRTGEFVLPPEYSLDSGYDGQYYGGKDTGIWVVTRWSDQVWGEDEDGEEILLHDNKEGFFDIRSGFFSGLVWEAVWPWPSQSRLIPVIDDTFRSGFVDRTTGELVIPCLFQSVDPSIFSEGVASVAYQTEDGNNLAFFLIDETGSEIPLPKGIHSLYAHHAADGRIAVKNEKGLLGFADLQGNVVIQPQFIYVNDFQQGLAVVQFPQEDWAVIDRDGRVLRRGLDAEHWSGPKLTDEEWEEITGEKRVKPEEPLFPDFLSKYEKAKPFENGLAFVQDGTRRGYVDLNGNEVFFWQEDDDE